MNTIQRILSLAFKVFRTILLFILVIFGLWFSYHLICHSGRDQCGIVGNRVDIGAPVLIMRVMNGKPDSIQSYSEFPPTNYRYDTMTLFGHPNSSITYSHVIFNIRQIHASIPLQEEEGEQLLHRAAESMKREYAHLPHLTCGGSDGYVVMQSMDGACSFTIELTLKEDRLLIDIVDFS